MHSALYLPNAIAQLLPPLLNPDPFIDGLPDLSMAMFNNQLVYGLIGMAIPGTQIRGT